MDFKLVRTINKPQSHCHSVYHLRKMRCNRAATARERSILSSNTPTSFGARIVDKPHPCGRAQKRFAHACEDESIPLTVAVRLHATCPL
jgi:hypothetical protein